MSESDVHYWDDTTTAAHTITPPQRRRTDVHLTCCRTWLALCGKFLDETWTGTTSEDDVVTCTRCVILDEEDVHCGVRLCRARSWIRFLGYRAVHAMRWPATSKK